MRSRGFAYAVIGGTGVTSIGIGGVLFGLSFYFQTVANLSPEFAGLLMAPLPLGLIVSSLIAGRTFDRTKAPAMLTFFGLLVYSMALIGVFVVIANSNPLGHVSIWYLSCLLGVIGVGGGFWWTPTFTAVMKFAKPEFTGVANGTATMLVNVGLAAGIALTTFVSATFLPPAVASRVFLGNPGNITVAEAYLFGQGIGLATLVSAAIIFISLPFYVLIAREQRKQLGL
jgi:MFS family permease